MCAGWSLVFEDPVSRGLWLGKGTPRAWWAAGEQIALTDAATRYGRLSYSATVKADSCSINVTVPLAWSTAASGYSCTSQSTDEAWCAAPRGGLMVRVRLPGDAAISSATIGATVWDKWADKETLLFSLEDLAQPGLHSKLQSIAVHY
jgi:hypothetical protein